MTPSTINLFKKSPPITWEKLPDDFILPDEPVDNNLQPLLAAALRESEGGEYSINPHYPYGKWYFYEQILQVPVYGIFQPKTGELDVYCLVAGKYEQQLPDENNRYWIKELNLFIGIWQGTKAEFTTNWLRWWDKSGNLLLWGSELVEQERQRAEQERQRAEQEKQRAERLAAKLRALGVEVDDSV